MKRALLLALLLPQSVMAATGYYLVSVYDVEGQRTLDYQYWNARSGGRSVSAPDIGLGYGVTGRWYTELIANYFRPDGGPTHLTGVSWQNDYLLTQGQYAFDLALHTRIERYDDGARGYGLEFGPVLQTEVGRTQFNANLFFQRDYRTERANAMQMTYQWQAKYRWKSALQFGLQGFGEVGPWDNWLSRSEQSHRAGPLLAGSRELDATHELKYEAAYLVGKNAARKAKSLTLRVQYVF